MVAVVLLGAVMRPGQSASIVIELLFGFAGYAGVFAAVWLAVAV